MEEENLSTFIWAVADLLRGDFKQSDYGRVILPFTLLRRLDCLLDFNAEPATSNGIQNEMQMKFFKIVLKDSFSHYTLEKVGYHRKNITEDKFQILDNLTNYINLFSLDIRDIFQSFDFLNTIKRLDKVNLLFLVTDKFFSVNLHPNRISNFQMGLIFEELIRKFAELSNETSGEYFTPREVVRLIVKLLFSNDNKDLQKNIRIKTIYDPTAGTGGMLSIADEYLKAINLSSSFMIYGQELNPESYAICKADMLIKGYDITNISLGNTLSDDRYKDIKFDYMLSNPPFGLDWKKIKSDIIEEYTGKRQANRFRPGLPRVSDSSLLFLMHLISKMRLKKDGGSRIGIVLSGSPLFAGGAGSGESEIRRFLLENDLIESIILLPTDMFYNTSISTYIWILSNKKSSYRKGKVQLIDASSFFEKMRKNLGNKRKYLSDNHINEITEIYSSFKFKDNEGVPVSKIIKNDEFGYKNIIIERPKTDDKGLVILGVKGKLKGKPLSDPYLRDSEKIPLSTDIDEYFKKEIIPSFPNSWINHQKTRIGYEISFQKYFYVFKKQRNLDEIDADLRIVSKEIIELLRGLNL